MALNKIKINNITNVNTGVVYDITKATSQSYDSLSAALGTNGNNVPSEVREGGMSVRFVQTSDNKYVQWRLTSTSFTIEPALWKNIDDEIKTVISILSKPLNYTIREYNKAVTDASVLVSADPYFYTNAIYFHAGESIIMAADGTAISVLAMTNNEYSSFTPIVTVPDGTGWDIVREFTYTFQASGLYVFTARTTLTVNRIINTNQVMANTRKCSCYSSSSESNKTVNVSDFVLSESCALNIHFVEKNTANNVTLNINQTGAKPIYLNGELVSSTNSWLDQAYCEVIYSEDIDAYVAFQRYVHSLVTFNKKIALQGGSYDLANGKSYIFTTENEFFENSITRGFIKFDSRNDRITINNTSDFTHFYFVCYDKNYNYLNSISDSYSFPDNTSYIKISVNHLKTNGIKEIELTVTNSTGELVIEKEIFYGLEPYEFLFETAKRTINNDVDNSSYVGENQRFYDLGYIILPPNYSNDGVPVPLVIFVHGTEMFQWNGITRNIIYNGYKPLLQFIAKNGYAVADCSCLTNEYAFGESNDDFKGSPLGLDCYSKLYDYIVNNYNVRTDGVRVFGKSSGGVTALQLEQMQPFPIRCCALLTPMVSFAEDFLSMDIADIEFVLDQFGINNIEITQDYLENQSQKNAVDAESQKFCGYEPFTYGSNLNYQDAFTKILNCGFHWGIVVSSMPQLQAIVDVASKCEPKPVKTWIAQDDVATPYIIAKMYVDMSKRGGSISYLRTMPNGTGQHACTDTSQDAIRMDYITKYGGTVNITVAFAEMVDWFNMW